MDLVSLESFMKVCDCRSFTRAAEELFISQPALSKRIKSLEEELGVTLLERGGQKIDITPAGWFMYDKAKELLKSEMSLREKMRWFRSGEHGTLHLAVTPGVPTKLLVPAISRISLANPDAEIVLECSSSLNLTHLMLENRISLAIGLSADLDTLTEYAHKVIATSTPRILVGEGNRLFNREQISSDDLKGENMVVISEPVTTGVAKVTNYVMKSGLAPRSVTYCRTFQECVYYVATGRYVCSSATVANEVYEGCLGDHIRSIPVAHETSEELLRMGSWEIAYDEDVPLAREFADFFV